MQNPYDILQSSSAITTDMHLLQQFSKSPFKAGQSISKINNLNSLTNLLKYKNSLYNYSDQHRQRNQVWIINKRGDVRPLIDRAKEMRQEYDKKEEEKIRQQNSYFYITPTDLEEQSKFIYKSLEYSVFGVVQHSQADAKFRKQLVSKIMKSKRQKIPIVVRQDEIAFSRTTIPVLNLKQNKEKTQLYLKAICNLFLTEQKLENKQWTAAFKVSTKIKIWEILDGLVPTNPKQKVRQENLSLSKTAIRSLKMVQAQFNSTLPSNYESILYYITTNYLRKMQGNFINEGSVGPVWAIAYALYKAGRKQQFYRYIPDIQIRKMFQHVDASIEAQKPTKILGVAENKDAFHDQLAFCLGGAAKYSSEVLCNPNSLDMAWIFLRNVGIFPESEQKFIQLRRDMYDTYKNMPLDQAKIKNLAYLLCFEQLVEIGPNQMMDQQDYLHYLITLYHSPLFKKLYLNRLNILQKNLTERLIQFVEKLLIEDRKQSMYYILLLPHESLANEVSSVFTKLKLIEKVKWKEFAKYLPSKLYADLVESTCQKYVDIHHQYCVAAQKIQQLLQNQERSLDYISEMNIRAILQFRKDDENIFKGQSIVRNIFKNNEKLQIEYGPLFQFFKQYNKLSELILQRTEDKIYKFIKSCKHILISQQIRVDTANVLEKLAIRNGFDCYLYYMKNVVKAYQIAMTKMGRLHELQELQRLTLSAVVGLLDIDQYRQYAKSEAASSLIKMLQESLYKYV